MLSVYLDDMLDFGCTITQLPSFQLLPNITLDRKQEIIDFVIELNKNSNKYNMRSKHIYRKLICTLMKQKEKIRCSEDLDDIKNMGTKTKEQIVKKIFNEPNTTVDLQNNAPFEHCSIIVEDVKGIESNAAKTDTKVEGTVSQSRQKKYLPSYKSGAYAILKVLYKEDGMSKKLICHKGNKYSNTEFSTASRLSAWNGIKTLTKKELVYKDDKKYYLTENGKDLCKELFYNESTIIQDSEVKLVIDSREMKSRRERSFFQSYFDTVEIQHITKNIELGDFIWTCGDDVLDFIIERKKGSDFCSSISDGRMKNQKQRLLDSGIGNIYYIVENLKESDMNRIGRNYVYSYLNSPKNENITVIETDDINETAKVVQMIDEKVKSDMYVSNIICVEPKKARLDEYIDKGTKNSNYNIKNVFTIILCTVRGLNAGKAQVIADKYLTYANFLECSKNLSFLDELANIEYEGQKIGICMANRINYQICTQ